MRLLWLALVCVRLASAECHSPGVERWPIKTSIPPGADFLKAKPEQLSPLMKLKNPPAVKNNDAKFKDARIPAFQNTLGLKEGDFVSVTGYLYLLATQDTHCEYHIHLTGHPPTTHHTSQH